MKNTRIRKPKALSSVILCILLALGAIGLIPNMVFADNDLDSPSDGQAASYDTHDKAAAHFQFTVRTPANNATFILPTSSDLNGTYQAKDYNWLIEWGDGESEYASGVSLDGDGIGHTYALAGEYKISILPNGPTDAWLAAFGFNYGYSGTNTWSNRAMVTEVNSPLRPEMTRTAAQVQGLEAAPDNEWSYVFSSCSNLRVISKFAGWDSVTSVGDYFACSMFANCLSLTTLPDGFTLPQSITTVNGCGFAMGMFSDCSSLVCLPDGFDFPQNIEVAGDQFADSMFYNCSELQTLPDSFNFPQGILDAGDSFAMNMFAYCQKLTMLPDAFSLPAGITAAGDNFVYSMFYACSDLEALPNGFTFPQGLDSVGDYFAADMFRECESLATLPAGFNLPQGITQTGGEFASYMFAYCSSLGPLPAGFNLPQSVSSQSIDFADGMFNQAGGPAFQVNAEFSLPASIPVEGMRAFHNTFVLARTAPQQVRSAASIIGSCPTPLTAMNTFDKHFDDLDYIDVNWGGGGLHPPIVGEAGSGDLNGDGMVTMDEVILTLQATLDASGLSPEQFAAIDMDYDDTITMTDVILALQKTV
ncbi:MAG: leucine-rich repeat protein [Coriobacteriia bacterium]|nr:leucine-rich repeat protein [Coriobacteriia bacterium]